VAYPFFFLTLNKQLARAAVGITAASLGLASLSCSSKSSSAPAGGDDAGTGAPEDAAVAALVPCDAALSFPTDGAAGTACGQCLEAMCASQLTECQMDCVCQTSVECLAANHNSYTGECMETALPAISAGNVGLMAVASCLLNCPACSDPDAN
jgi:hypothetical protein